MNSAFNLNSFDVALLIASLNIFVSNDIEDVSKSRKSELNISATSAMYKLNNKQTNFNAQDLQIMYISLVNLENIINKTNSVPVDFEFEKDSSRILTCIKNLCNLIDSIFESNGIHLANQYN